VFVCVQVAVTTRRLAARDARRSHINAATRVATFLQRRQIVMKTETEMQAAAAAMATGYTSRQRRRPASSSTWTATKTDADDTAQTAK